MFKWKQAACKKDIFDFIANVKRVVFRIERHVQTKKREKGYWSLNIKERETEFDKAN